MFKPFEQNSFSGYAYSSQQIDEQFNNMDSEMNGYSYSSTQNDIYSKLEVSTENISKNPIIQRKTKKNKQIKLKDLNLENQETKNLPSFFIRQFCDKILSVPDLNMIIKKKIKKVKNECQTKASINLLCSLLRNPKINEQISEYITSFEFLDQILSSPKLQDVVPPIKYINKLFEACNNPSLFTSWK